MRLLLLELPSRVPFSPVMSRMFFFWMLPHFLLVSRPWEVSSPDSFTETQLSQLRSRKFSQLLLTVKLKSVSPFFRVREKWLLIIRNSEISSSVESHQPQEDTHRL